MEFLTYPPTIKMLAAEIITVCDAYVSRKIGVEDLRKLVLHYASNYPEMLFNAQELNSTVLNRIGKKRAKTINKMLEGYQQRLSIAFTPILIMQKVISVANMLLLANAAQNGHGLSSCLMHKKR